MAHAHELTRKEMKGPDKFQQAVAGAAGWVGGHQKQIALAVVGVVVVLAVALGVTAVQRRQEEKAGALLYKVLEDAAAPISSVPLPVPGPTFASAQEQQRAVVSAAAEVRKGYPSSGAARTAALASGDAHLRLGEWDAALGDYQAFLAAAPAGDSLRFSALDGVARALEGKGDLAAAADAFSRLGAEVPFLKDRAAIDRARVLARAGKVDEARKVLAGFPDEFKDSLLKPEAAELLARLGGK